jgi:hypothetical protein
VATGWQELLEQRRKVPAGTDEAEAWNSVWSTFASLVIRSPRFTDGPGMLRAIESSSSRYTDAFLIALLLAPTEWPIEWEARRPELVRALSELRRQTRLGDPQASANPEPATFFAQIELGVDKAAIEISHRVLAAAVDLLGTPCRRDQIGSVADLCNVATSKLHAAYQRAVAQQGETAMREPLLGAHLRYRVAALRYDDAAMVMNNAIGSVLFHPYDAAGPPPPALPKS